MSTQPDPRRWLALAVLGTAFFMVVLDATIVFTALPSIADDLGFSPGGVQWVITAYVLVFGGLQLLGGRSADILGRRRVFMAGVVVFVAASLMGGLAWSGGVLIGARVVQGISAAIMSPSALSIVMTTFEEGAERNKALGVWGGLGGVGATAGLLIGGPVTDGLGWEWVFFINVPVGLCVLALSPVVLRESRDHDVTRAFDPAAALTITAALMLLVYTVFKAPEVGWGSTRTLGLLSASVLLMALFALIETRSAAPLVPLRIFCSRTLVGGNIVILVAGMAVDGTLIILTLYAQQVLGYSAMQFGLMMAVMTVSSVMGVFAGQHIVTRIGFRPVAAIGMVLIGIGCLMLTQVSADGSYLGDIFVGYIIFGPGMGAAFVAAQISALSGVAEQEAGLASGLVETSFNIGSGLGIAVFSAVAVSRTNDVLSGAGQQDQPFALTEGFQSAFSVGVVIAVLGLLAALALLGRRHAADAAPTEEGMALRTNAGS